MSDAGWWGVRTGKWPVLWVRSLRNGDYPATISHQARVQNYKPDNLRYAAGKGNDALSTEDAISLQLRRQGNNLSSG